MWGNAGIEKAVVLLLMMLGAAAVPALVSEAAGFPVEFVGPYSAVPIDSNSDTLYETLNVYAGVNVNSSGWYTLDARLYQTFGSWIALTGNTSYLTAGNHTVTAVFRASEIFDDHLNGTYSVLMEFFNRTIVGRTTFTAGNFTYDQFSQGTHFVTVSEVALDPDADGLYNYLRITAVVSIDSNPSWIRLEGTIEGTCNAASDPTGSTGIVSLVMDFDGEYIRGKGADGPYAVKLDIMGSGRDLLSSTWYWTSNYSCSEFSNSYPDAPIKFAPPHSGYPVDTDSDSFYERFDVNVSVNVTEPGWYHVVGFLYTTSTYWTSGVWASQLMLFELGPQVAVISFPAFYIRAYGLDGTFIVSIRLLSQSSTRFASMDWTLGDYDGTRFEYVMPCHIEGVVGDSGVDINADGEFEYLSVSVQVHVIEAGYYGLTTWIQDVSTNTSSYVRVAADMTAGIRTVELRYPGYFIVEAAKNGPYSIMIGLMMGTFDPYVGLLDGRDYTTQYYPYTQFQATPAASFESYDDSPIDVNGDGAQEYLAVRAVVNVRVPGTYNISGRLSVLVGFIETVWNQTYLDSGNTTITLLFPGDIIKASKWNGSYLVYLNLSDEAGNVLASPGMWTDYYTWVVFAKPPVAGVVAEPSGDEVLLNASVSTVEADFYEVRWDFDSDGIWDTGWSAVATILHVFPGPGDYLVTVEVKDIRGLTDKTTIVVHVPPSAKIIPFPLPWPLLVVCAGVAVGAVVVFMAWPLESLVIMLLTLLLPLYSRLKSDEVLDNYKRGVIHGLILAHPGISFTEMKEAMSISSGSLVYHLDILQDKGEVLCRKSGTTMRYYLDGSPVASMVRLGLTDLQLEIVKHILSSGDTTKNDLQIAVKCSKQTVHYNLKKLVTDGILVSSYSGGHRVYRVASGARPEISRALEPREGSAEVAAPEQATSKTDS